ncbi:hypothetical protein E2C01_004262 [Portunus trituberculatus]|uniref:Uncharacterized protein n=1 Tax=Portunus trituberculatus TaxID=210409 RepID=A0A5B7CPG9_PORTR|nr:hypothetical protein [Portunus trituberculatus]
MRVRGERKFKFKHTSDRRTLTGAHVTYMRCRDQNKPTGWNHACFGIRGVFKRTGSNPVHGPSVGWTSSLGATVS